MCIRILLNAVSVCAMWEAGGGSLTYWGLFGLYGENGFSAGYSDAYGLRPCFALKSTIKITGGIGTSGNPYTME